MSTSPRHINAAPSSSTRKPIDTTFSTPPGPPFSPFDRISWAVDLSVVSAEPAVDAEHAGDAEAPDVGVEHADREPRAASAVARFTVTDDLPTPPFPLATATTRVVAGTSVGAACSRAFNRARCIACAFCCWLISP